MSFRPLRVIVGLDYKAADAWFIEFRAAASQCMVRVDQPRARGRGAFSHAVSAHFSGGRGCFWGRGLAKHDCRADRTQLSRCGRVGQRVGCFSWSRSWCLCHSTLYRSCGAVIMSILTRGTGLGSWVLGLPGRLGLGSWSQPEGWVLGLGSWGRRRPDFGV